MPSIVRGGGSEAVERMQLLLARQDDVGGAQRRRHLPRLLRQPPGIKSDERRRDAKRGEGSQLVDERQLQLDARIPGQGLVGDDEHRGGGEGDQPERDRVAQRQRRRRHRDRRDHEHGERIVHCRRSGRAASPTAGCRRRAARSHRER
ncbi:MAG: hypothetical protein WDN31_01430 [Hyphomicrobium sp.]